MLSSNEPTALKVPDTILFTMFPNDIPTFIVIPQSWSRDPRKPTLMNTKWSAFAYYLFHFFLFYVPVLPAHGGIKLFWFGIWLLGVGVLGFVAGVWFEGCVVGFWFADVVSEPDAPVIAVAGGAFVVVAWAAADGLDGATVVPSPENVKSWFSKNEIRSKFSELDCIVYNVLWYVYRTYKFY